MKYTKENIKKLQIVAPAGDIEKFYAAVDAGADEVYMGLQGFGARKSAKNFTLTEYKAAIDYAHEHGTRVLMTLNTIMMDNEFQPLYHNLNELYKYGLDAIIVQDLGMFKFIKENFPEIEIHGSTQMTVSNHVEAEYLRELGFSRVVLSRELSLGEIKSIREKTTIELEIFVSGALCVCYSGKCYMSSFIGARSGNRGMCAQPCRKTYSVDGRDMGYILSPKDQLMGKEEIDFLKEIGVESIKIEGRMKEAKYVHELTEYFKTLIEGEERKERISRIFNRGYGKGYFHGEEKNLINSKYSFNLGKQIGIFNGKEVKISEKIMLGDGVTYLSKDFEKLGGAYISKIVHRTFDRNREKSLSSNADKSKEAFPGETLIMQDIPVGTRYLFKSFDKEIEDTINLERKHTEKKIEITGKFQGELNQFPKLTFYYKNLRGEILTGEALGEKEAELAGKKPITAENIQDKLSELGETEFFLGSCDFELEDNLFIPVSIIKAMKRDAAENLIEKIADSYRRENYSEPKYIIDKAEESVTEKNPVVSAIVTTREQEKKLIELGINKIYYANVGVVKEKNLDKIKYDSPIAYTLLDAKENPKKNITLHWSLNVSNRYALSQWEKNPKIETVMLSPELSFEKIKNLGATKLKKALLIYSKPKVMQIEAGVTEKSTEIKNDKEDSFSLVINRFGNSEIYLNRALDITDSMKEIRTLLVDEVVLEFRNESLEEIEKIVKGISDIKNPEKQVSGYNYWKGVF